MHGILEKLIQALSRTTSVFKDFPGLENLEKNSRTRKSPESNLYAVQIYKVDYATLSCI